MPIYDFMADLSQLQKNYESYDDKRKKQYDNLKESIVGQNNMDYSQNKDINTINENDGIDNVPDKSNSSVLNSIKMFNNSSGGKTTNSYNNGDTIQLSDNQLGDEGGGWSNPEGAPTNGSGTATAGGGNFVGNYGAAIGAAAGSIGDSLPKNTEFNNGRYVDPNVEKDEKRDETIGKTKDAVSSALGPWGMLFRGVEKLGNKAGDSIGGAGGAVVSSLFSPDETVMSMNSDDSIKTSDKIIGSILPAYGAIVNYNAKAKRKRESMLDAIHNDQDAMRREQEQRQKDGLESLDKLTALRKAQLGYIS